MNNDANELKKYMYKIERMLGVQDESEKTCCGITLAQCHALVEIGQAGSLSLNELAEMLNLDKSTMSRTVENLVKSGYAARQTDEQCRRSVSISLTEEGRALYTGIDERMNAYFEQIYGFIPEDKRIQVMESLSILFLAISKSVCCE